MNDHPDHLLAELVDGELTPASRAEVESHLAACERCREELALAREAAVRLSGLDDLEPPAGIPLAVRRELRATPRRTWRGVGMAAAAAGLIAAGAITVSVIGRGGPQDTLGGGGQTGEPAAPAPAQEGGDAFEAQDAQAGGRIALTPTYRETGREYDQDSLARLGRRFRDEAAVMLDLGFPPTATAFLQDFDLADLAPDARRAYRCVIEEVPPSQPVAPVAVEGASFEGTPAYVAAFLQGPTPDSPYDRVVIWVVEREGCSLLSLASQQLE